MAALTHYFTTLAVRWLHLLGMAIVLGGAVLAWWLLGHVSRADSRTQTPAPIATVARGYEWLFWAAIGVVVMTGVGNLGGLAPAIPGPGSRWGLTFTVKLVGVVGLLVGSLLRTLIVSVGVRTDGEAPPVRARLLGRSYGATALYVLGLVALAEVLAHG